MQYHTSHNTGSCRITLYNISECISSYHIPWHHIIPHITEHHIISSDTVRQVILLHTVYRISLCATHHGVQHRLACRHSPVCVCVCYVCVCVLISYITSYNIQDHILSCHHRSCCAAHHITIIRLCIVSHDTWSECIHVCEAAPGPSLPSAAWIPRAEQCCVMWDHTVFYHFISFDMASRRSDHVLL